MKKKDTIFQETILIEIDPEHVKKFYYFIIEEKKKHTHLNEFEKGKIPISYIREYFYEKIKIFISEFFFYMEAQKKIIKKFNKKGLTLPININPNIFLDLETFELKYSISDFFNKITKENFENKKIKLPLRKKYKDLDKQAISFVKKENENFLKFENKINYEDWIQIEVFLCDDNEKLILNEISTLLWIKISSQKYDLEIANIFLNKKINDIFFSKALFLQNYFSASQFIKCNFKIIIKEHVSSLFFNFKCFSKFFNIKKESDLYNKIIEVFSFKNDISLKREICQISFKKLFENYKISFSKNLFNQYKLEISKNLKINPDYLIFQGNKNFNENLKIFINQKIMEIVLIDYLSNKKFIKTEINDFYFFFNILQRNRLKDFLYFDLFEIKNEKKAIPISHEIIEKLIIREKTLQSNIKILEKN